MIYKHVLFYKNKFIICIFLRQNANEIYTELKVCPISYITRQRSLSYLSSVGAKSADQVPWFYHPHCLLNVIFFFFFLNPSMSRWIYLFLGLRCRFILECHKVEPFGNRKAHQKQFAYDLLPCQSPILMDENPNNWPSQA